jgi:hypothetical protein
MTIRHSWRGLFSLHLTNIVVASAHKSVMMAELHHHTESATVVAGSHMGWWWRVVHRNQLVVMVNLPVVAGSHMG